MAAQLTQAGTITREQTFLPIRRFPVAANANVAKGNVLFVDDTTGYVSTAAPATANEFTVKVVALGAANNTSGIAAALDVPCAVRGHFVTVVAGGAIKSGQKVQMGPAGKLGQVVAAPAARTSDKDVVGIYWAKEGGTIGGTDALELFVDTENWKQTDAADTNIVEIELF